MLLLLHRHVLVICSGILSDSTSELHGVRVRCQVIRVGRISEVEGGVLFFELWVAIIWEAVGSHCAKSKE